MTNSDKIGIIGIVIGIAGIGYTCLMHRKINKANEMITSSIDDLSNGVDVQVSDAMVSKAVDKAVEREVNRAVKNVCSEVTESTRRDIKTKVKTSVDEIYSTIRESVSKEVARDVANLNMDLLKDRVREEAKQMILNKFDDNLNSMLQDFNQNLTNVSKIYSSIADNMLRKPETVLKIGN